MCNLQVGEIIFSSFFFMGKVGLYRYNYNSYNYLQLTLCNPDRYSQTNKCTTITNRVYLAAPTYVSATNLPSSGGRPKNHSH
jgi:hypothetical protein